MKRFQLVFLCLATLVAVSAVGQIATTAGSILGVVKDQTGGVVPGAKVTCVSAETGGRYETAATAGGAYVCPSLAQGFYRVEAVAAGFRKAVISDIKVNVGLPTTTDVTLEVGQTTQTVEVQAEATPVITSTTAISTTVTGRQITELPLATREALDLAFQMAGASGGGGVRYSSFDGLPHGALNLTIDGINIQDNLLKSASGGSFYAYIRPRIDAVDEVTVSSAGNAANTGEGAVQIAFVTKRGTNDWHGGGFWYLRNNALNANTWFNNTNGLPRQILKLNQFGSRIGGPIKKNKLFLFFVWDDFRLPNAIARNRTVLKPGAIAGDFTYKGTDGANHTVNVLQMAGANGFRSTPDANITTLLKKIDSLRSGGQVGITSLDLFRDTMSFNNVGKQRRYFPTTRLDYAITDKMQLDVEWYYQGFRSFPDTLNSYDRTYPGFETLNGKPAEGGQNSNRHQSSMAFRWTMTPRMTNEFRLGENGGTVVFAGGMDQTLYPNNTRLGFPLSLTSPLSLPRDSRRNSPIWTIADTLAWQKGKHTLNYGFTFTRLSNWDRSIGTAVPLASTGITSNDPINSLFSATNFPSINTADISNAMSLYALLTGRLSGLSGVVNVDEKAHKYVQYAPLVVRNMQRSMGLFFTDTFRLRSTITLNYGLRWDYQGIPRNTNGVYTMPQGGYPGLWDVSGPGNLFKPGTMPGQPAQLAIAEQAWDKHFRNFAPSAGLAWSPSSDNRLLKAVFGKGGALRIGYSISYNREGLAHFTGVEGANVGPTASAALVADRDFKAGSLSYDGTIPPLVTIPTSFTFPLPMSSLTYNGSSLNWYDPNLRPPRIHSWSVGIQREIAKATVLEVRYVGNYGQDLWRQININETNIFENGFLKEFQAAQNNLNICTANRVACTGSATGALRFDNRGLPGQANTPIMTAAFAGTTGFTSSTFVTNLQQGTAGSFANSLATNNLYMPNLVKASYPANFFQASPNASVGGAWLLQNGAFSDYHSLQVEVRRRMSAGLLLNTSYVFSKGLSDLFGDSSSSATQPMTLRRYSLSTGASPYDIRHAFKINWLYELPFGPGKRFAASNNPVLSRLIGGWQINGIGRIQSGQAFLLTSGRSTLSQYDAGVIPMVPRSKLQSMGKIVKDPSGLVYVVDKALIGPDGRANPDYLQVPTVPGQLGYSIFLYGPGLVRIDGTLAKRVRVNERVNVELRAEVLNVFNFVNFMQASPSSSTSTASIQSTSFGRTTNYYQDFNGSQDPGGRVIQLVLRINF
jgi:hypothetical protein